MPRRLLVPVAVALALALPGCMGLGGSKPQNVNADGTPPECKDFQVRDGDFMWAYNGKNREDGEDSDPWFTRTREVVVEVCPFVDWGKMTVVLRDGSGNHVFNQTFMRASDEQTFQVSGAPGGWIVERRWEGYTGHVSILVREKV